MPHFTRLIVLLLCLALAPPALAATPSPLAGSEWRLVEIEGELVTAQKRPTMRFRAAGAVAGHGGCNRFAGGFTTGPTESVTLPAHLVPDPARRRAVEGPIAFTRIAATKMACPEGMALEARFFSVLSRAARFQRAWVGLPLEGPNAGTAARYSLTLYDAGGRALARFAWTDWD